MSVMAERKSFGTAEAAGIARCWSCKGPVPAAALFCGTCGSVQPPGDFDHFARLGLPRSFDVSEAELGRRYFELQARLHPDRFATRSPAERALSLAQATALNQAYQTLRDPLSRAAYLLTLAGLPAPTQGSGTVEDPELLTESLERREALAEARTAAEVDRIAAESEQEAARSIAALARAFADGALAEAGRLTLRLKYLVKAKEEARARRARLREDG